MSEESKKLKEIEARIDMMRKRDKDSDDFKVRDEVFDKRTFMNLYALAKKGPIEALGGSISTGKEANIFLALGETGNLAIKIYRINTSNFKAMQNYLIGDPRFGNIKGTKRAIITAWTRKEFRNLKRAQEVGVRVPNPIDMKENLLVMELIGEGEVPAPRLREVKLGEDEARRVFEIISGYISDLYNKARMVHADLSEFNILYDRGEPVIIDMGQSVMLEHPMARAFLERDISNVARYFKKTYGIGSEEEILAKLRADRDG